MKIFVMLLLSSALTIVSDAKPVRSVRTIGILSGSCERLIGFGTDLTDKCDSKAVNTEWSDGRDSFSFTSGDGKLVITFSGDGTAQIKEGADTAVQPLDAMIVTINAKPITVKAVGSCRFSNPYKGPVPISCDAHTAQGDFGVTFMTDGSTPNFTRMPR